MGHKDRSDGAKFSELRLSELLESGMPPLSLFLRDRILHDVARAMVPLHKHRTPHGCITLETVLLDFGLRARLTSIGQLLPHHSLSGDLQALEQLSKSLNCPPLREYYDAASVVRDFKQRNIFSDPPDIDLDREADALNVAFLWSNFVKGESMAVTSARQALHEMLLGAGQVTTTLDAISQLDDSPVKELFLGIVYIEGTGSAQNLDVAEDHLQSASNKASITDRLGALAAYYLARIRVEKRYNFAKEFMLALANEGNPFAQVFVSRAFASRPVLGSYSDAHFNELHFFARLAKTGYSVSQALGPLYRFLLSANEQDLLLHNKEFCKELRTLAKRSAESGNMFGRVTWAIERRQVSKIDFLRPDECSLAGALNFLSNKMQKAEFWFRRAGQDMGLAFINAMLEQQPTAKASWLTCMDCCYKWNIWLELVSYRIVRDKLFYSLLAARLDEQTILDSINFSKPQSIELVLEASAFMPHSAGEAFMQRVRERYLDSYGLRYLGALYRRLGKTKEAMHCYSIAAEKNDEGSDEAKVDMSVMLLEGGANVAKVEAWGSKAGFAGEVFVSGMLALHSLDVGQATQCFQVAAEANDPRAMWFLGELLWSENWIQKAGSFGFCEAFDSLGSLCYHNSKDFNGFWDCKKRKEESKMFTRFTRRIADSDSRIVATFEKWRNKLGDAVVLRRGE